MTKILLVAATQNEIDSFYTEYLKEGSQYTIEILITGVGMVKTTLALTKTLEQAKYDLVINAGIAGCFKKEIPLGTIVNVTEDIFSEIGAEDGNEWVDFIESGFFETEDIYVKSRNIDFHLAIETLPKVVGITVNTVHGSNESISKIQKRFSAIVESMEGAAVLFVCKEYGMKCIQFRSISNYVETRNLLTWDIPLAINNLNKFLIKILLTHGK